MPFPAFFDQAPIIAMIDPLSHFLGATPDGRIEYRYEDAVRLAGHSCPTVAGTWLMLAKGLKALYGEAMPERGAIEVHFPSPADEGVTGVMAAIASLVTGATAETGFKGLGGRFDRRHRLFFSSPLAGDLGLRRQDSMQGVIARFDASGVPADPQMRARLVRLIEGRGEAEDEREFARLWQERVQRLILDHADNPALVAIRAW
ncbi:MAG: hypothetical protein HZC25_09185 [Rhodospirillales bacterium]|nr:hypothetical protein [Rhodospirillales bacterium]